MGPRRFGLFFAVLILVGAAWWWLRGSEPAAARPALVPRERASTPPTAAPVAAIPASTSPNVDVPQPAATPAAGATAATSNPGVVTKAASPVSVAVIPSGRSAVETPQVSNVEMRLNLDRVRNSLRDYRSLYGENPVGTNAQIMQALNGDNPRGAKLGPEGMSSNADGEIVDQWGTALFFHQLSKDQMEIISAGPDKVMGTADDILVR